MYPSCREDIGEWSSERDLHVKNNSLKNSDLSEAVGI
jgi:hypothetical protein